MSTTPTPDRNRTSHLHAVSDQEALVLALRAEAFDRFRRRYRHDLGSQQTMVGALEAFARISSQGRCVAQTFPWELLNDELVVEDLWRYAVGERSRNTAQKWATAVRVMLSCCRRVGLLDHEQYLHASHFETKNGGRVLPPQGGTCPKSRSTPFLAPASVAAPAAQPPASATTLSSPCWPPPVSGRSR